MIKVRYPDHHSWHEVYAWLQANCERTSFYTGTDWDTKTWMMGEENRMVQFEKQADATMFALRWGG